ncbi:hypothetical protein DP113_07825 [Brasilonema octagenarum UFV-E1]|uniref:Cyanobacterial TRADD-N associated 2 transmembrane domain-containing protein n=2 Tax=Brasilonema TaxID=383614 RepID=A0A856MAR9_9CYAN|nr:MULTISPECIES: hypothetical protein [Brasilonema]NMF65535.1 hypothetical protein [Brasilonema octagenarum UFV-OR1]QDL07828.1 hypothetical protein DP114_07870 [Brasilonema sennae CENA114]QDL14188.1 hypothetical protein DP113_07825 [Brasilonema octagenarum UFV-E1]
MNFNISSKPQPNNNEAAQEMKKNIIEELLRQARLTFNLALSVTAASAMMTLSGVGLLYLNKVPEASLTTGAGILASISSVQFAKDAKQELCEMVDKLEE